MSKLQELRAWVRSAKQRGLVDVKFFPGGNREVSLEIAAGDALALLKSGSKYAEDISDISL